MRPSLRVHPVPVRMIAAFTLLIAALDRVTLVAQAQQPQLSAPASSPVPATPSAPVTVTIGDNNTVRISQIDGSQHRVFVQISGVPTTVPRSETPKIEDSTLDGVAIVGTKLFRQVQTGNPRAWLFDATVTNLPTNTSENHMATVSFGGELYSRPYTLTDRPPGTATWTIAVPNVPWILTGETYHGPLTVTVAAQDVPIADLTIAQSTLRDASNLTQLGRDDLELVPDKTDGLSVPAHTTRAFDIHLKPKSRIWPHGKFTGNLQLGARNMPDVQTASVTLYSTSLLLRVLGVLCICLGLWLSNALAQRLKPRIARAEALRPVIVVRASLADLERALDSFAKASVPFPHTSAHLKELGSLLTTSRLDADGLLPPAFNVAFTAALDSTAKLQARLTEIATQVAAIATVIREGIAPAIQDRNAGVFDGNAVSKALVDLDRLGAEVSTQADARTKIPIILESYRVRQGLSIQSFGTSALAAASDPVTLEQASYVIEHGSRLAWHLAGVMTVVTGTLLLVAINSGFAWVDVLYCFLWGAGLPTAGAAFQALSAPSVATTLGLTLPRT